MTTTEPIEPTTTRVHPHALAPLIVAAYVAVYLAWGGTYLGIRVAIETIPAFLMAGSRFFLAGIILMTCLRLFQPAAFHWGTRREWRDAAIVGVLLIVGGNGGITLSERVVPSSVVALITAGVPLWMVLFDWVRPTGRRPSLNTALGLLLGFGGIVILCSGSSSTGRSSALNWGYATVLAANLCWSAGAIYSRHVHAAGSPLLAVSRQMLIGGTALLVLGAISGELRTFSFAAISQRSALGYAYLITCGSLLGFTAYVWLMKVSTPARVGTISYVNPVIAVLLGWAIGGESLSLQIGLSAAVIVASVVIVLRRP